MNCLLVHNPEQGHSYHLAEVASALSGKFKTKFSVMTTDDELPKDTVDVVILWCAIRWWKANRAKLTGRPWVCAVSWCFDDLLDVTTPGMGQVDAGINSVVCNCKQYVLQTSAAFASSFALPPVYDPGFGMLPGYKASTMRSSFQFGTVLPNIVDRDFSQLILTRQLVDKHFGPDAAATKIVIMTRANERMRLPAELADLPMGTIDENAYKKMFYFIPVPRITDYRGGVMPAEILRALQEGTIPLMFNHPVLPHKLRYMRTFSSVKQYSEAIASVNETRMLNSDGVTVSGCKPEQLAIKLSEDYAEWLWHASKNV